MQVAYDYRHLANISCNLWETIVVWQPSPAICGRPSYLYEPSPATCERPSYPYKHLLQLAGDYRTPTNISCNLRETIVPLHTISCNLRETIVPLHTISCNLRETFVPLQTSPATCGRPSYPYEKVLQHFFRLRFVLLIESPTFVSLKYNTQKR